MTTWVIFAASLCVIVQLSGACESAGREAGDPAAQPGSRAGSWWLRLPVSSVAMEAVPGQMPRSWVWASSPQDLHKKYSYIRKTRPDGNCFYRAFGFSHLEALLDDSKELQR